MTAKIELEIITPTAATDSQAVALPTVDTKTKMKTKNVLPKMSVNVSTKTKKNTVNVIIYIIAGLAFVAVCFLKILWEGLKVAYDLSRPNFHKELELELELREKE